MQNAVENDYVIFFQSEVLQFYLEISKYVVDTQFCRYDRIVRMPCIM